MHTQYTVTYLTHPCAKSDPLQPMPVAMLMLENLGRLQGSCQKYSNFPLTHCPRLGSSGKLERHVLQFVILGARSN
jgi:hypothetical protein